MTINDLSLENIIELSSKNTNIKYYSFPLGYNENINTIHANIVEDITKYHKDKKIYKVRKTKTEDEEFFCTTIKLYRNSIFFKKTNMKFIRTINIIHVKNYNSKYIIIEGRDDRKKKIYKDFYCQGSILNSRIYQKIFKKFLEENNIYI